MGPRALLGACAVLAVGAGVTLGFASDLSSVGRSIVHHASAHAARSAPNAVDPPGEYCPFPDRTAATSLTVAPPMTAAPDTAALLLLDGQSSAAAKERLCTGVSPAAQQSKTVFP